MVFADLLPGTVPTNKRKTAKTGAKGKCGDISFGCKGNYWWRGDEDSEGEGEKTVGSYRCVEGGDRFRL